MSTRKSKAKGKDLQVSMPADKDSSLLARNAVASSYSDACKELGTEPDPSVLTSLDTNWEYMLACSSFSLLPLLLALERTDGFVEVRSLRLYRSPNAPHGFPNPLADANARVVRELLQKCPSLSIVDVTKVGFGFKGLIEISAGVALSKSLRVLKLRGNPRAFAAFHDKSFVDNIFICDSLEVLDISENNLDFSTVKMYLRNQARKGKQVALHDIRWQSIIDMRDDQEDLTELKSNVGSKSDSSDDLSNFRNRVRKVAAKSGAADEKDVSAKKARDVLVIVNHGNYLFEEVLNTLTHAVGAFLGSVGSIILLWNASHKGRPEFYSSLVYCFTLVFLYVSSAVYHSTFANKKLSDYLGILDHCAIYLLIAGSHTPFCLVALRSHYTGVWLALTQWGLALSGVVLTLVSKRVHIPFHHVFELLLYVLMGWSFGVVYNYEGPEVLLSLIDPEAVRLLIYGGLAYTFGIVFFIIDRASIHPAGHIIWHVFVMLGSLFHYFAILFYVVGLQDFKPSTVTSKSYL